MLRRVVHSLKWREADELVDGPLYMGTVFTFCYSVSVGAGSFSKYKQLCSCAASRAASDARADTRMCSCRVEASCMSVSRRAASSQAASYTSLSIIRIFDGEVFRCAWVWGGVRCCRTTNNYRIFCSWELEQRVREFS